MYKINRINYLCMNDLVFQQHVKQIKSKRIFFDLNLNTYNFK